MAQDTLAARVRAKYPGVYDDLDDATLEQKVRAKFPGVYDDLPSSAAASPSTPPAPTGRGTGRDVELATGIAKGVGNTITGLGELAYRYIPGVAQVSDATQRAIFGDVQPAGPMFTGIRKELQPTTPWEQAGYTGEQIAEYFAPVTRATKYVRGAEAVKAGTTALAQTVDPTTAGVSGALAAALPGAAQATRAASALERSAQKSIVGALGPTKEWAKAEAKILAPEILERGIKGSRIEILDQARAMTQEVGKKIGTEIAAAAQAGETVSGFRVLESIDTAREALLTPTAAGTKIPIAGTEPVIRRLDKLTAFVQQLPPDIPIDQASRIKTTWDHIVSKAGLYGPKAQASATDSASAFAIREAASSFRKLIERGNVTLADLNQHYKFWKGLGKVLTETERRTQAHGGGLTAGVTAGTGIVGGLISGEGAQDKFEKALLYGVAGRQVIRLLQSPSWATRVSAPLKQTLADALASGSTARVTSAIQQISAALPSQLRQTMSGP